MEIEALPRTLKTIELEKCERLKNIPSFEGLTSLTKFRLEGCYEIEKIQGLEKCTRLEELFAETWWEVSGIESLEHMRNLKEVVLKANKGAVIEHCIQRLQEWPDEDIMICAEAVPDAASLVEDLLFSRNLVIVESISNQNMEYKSGLKSVLNAGISNGDAIMFCFVVNCVSSQMTVWITLGRYALPFVKVRRGRWAVVRVVTEHSREGGFYLLYDGKSGGVEFSIYGEEGEVEFGNDDGEGEVEKGLVVRGAEQTAMEALCTLLPIFS